MMNPSELEKYQACKKLSKKENLKINNGKRISNTGLT
jgi:hypothetical protein